MLGILLCPDGHVCKTGRKSAVRRKKFFRNLVALVFALVILKKDHVHFSGKKENIKYLVIRSVAGTVGILCNFYAVDHLVLSDASLLA